MCLRLRMETCGRRLAFESSRFDLRRERTSKLLDTPLLKHGHRMHHLLKHGFDLGYIALLQLQSCIDSHRRRERADSQSYLEDDSQYSPASRPQSPLEPAIDREYY